MTSYQRSSGSALPSARLADAGYHTALALLLLVMAGNFYSWLVHTSDVVTYPFGIEYGEGIVWQQMAALANGSMYSDFHAFPYLVFHYTPLYHLVTFLASEVFGNPLAIGRLVSALSTIGNAALIAVVVGQVAGRDTPRPVRVAGSLSAFLALFTFANAFAWSSLMRVDMLAVFFNTAGVALFLASLKRPRLFYLAAIFFVLAVYTKQTMIPGAFACFLVSLLYRFAFTLRVLMFTLVLGGGALAGLTAATGGEFIRHIFLYNVNRLDLNNVRVIFVFIFSSIIVELAAVGAYLLAQRIVVPRSFASLSDWRLTLRDNPESLARFTILVYLGVAAVHGLCVLKSGAASNYLLPVAAVASIFFGLFVVELMGWSWLRSERPLGTLPKVVVSIICFIGIWQIVSAGPRAIDIRPPEDSRDREQVLERIERVPGLVWSEDMALTRMAGKDVIAEPAIITELAIKGMWDQGPFVDMIRERKFDLVVINSTLHFDAISKSIEKNPIRFTPEIVSAIETSYPVVETIGDYRLYYPDSNNRK